MVRWYHAIFSAYGFWLPNDPRGSWSDFVHAWELFRFGGPATKVTGRRSYAHDPHDVTFRLATKHSLLFPPVRFDAAARRTIAEAFAAASEEFNFTLHACAVSHDHVHLIAGRGERSIEQTVAVLKARATRRLTSTGLHPLQTFRNSKGAVPTPWSESCWRVFIDDDVQLRAAVEYVKRHPEKENLPPQDWSFLKPV